EAVLLSLGYRYQQGEACLIGRSGRGQDNPGPEAHFAPVGHAAGLEQPLLLPDPFGNYRERSTSAGPAAPESPSRASQARPTPSPSSCRISALTANALWQDTRLSSRCRNSAAVRPGV